MPQATRQGGRFRLQHVRSGRIQPAPTPKPAIGPKGRSRASFSAEFWSASLRTASGRACEALAIEKRRRGVRARASSERRTHRRASAKCASSLPVRWSDRAEVTRCVPENDAVAALRTGMTSENPPHRRTYTCHSWNGGSGVTPGRGANVWRRPRLVPSLSACR